MRPLLVPLHTEDNRIDAAILYASMAHQGQKDKGGFPYILHPLRVMMSLFPYVSLSKDQNSFLAAAVLHDSEEDCGVGIDNIHQIFGKNTAEWVSLLSHRAGQSRAQYINTVFYSLDAIEPRLIKLADMLDNTSPGRMDFLSSETREKLFAKYAQDFKGICRFYTEYDRKSSIPRMERSLAKALAKRLKTKIRF